MTLPGEPEADRRYTRVAAILHGLIALFILFNLAFGYCMEGLPAPLKFVILPLHISAGMSVLALTVVRILWRLIHLPPPEEPGMALWEINLAHIVHVLLYCGMVLMPLGGWAILSAHPAPNSAGYNSEQAALAAANPGKPLPPRGDGLKIWWSIALPSIPAVQAIGETPGGLLPQKRLHDTFVRWHGVGGFLMIILLLGHVAGALKHQWIDRMPMLQRMRLLGKNRR